MRSRGLIVLGLLVALLAGYIWFVERQLPSREERRAAGKRLVRFEREEIERIVVRSGEERIELVRSTNEVQPTAPPWAPRWQIQRPRLAEADNASVDQLLDVLLELEKLRTLDGMTRPAAGLAPPRGTLTLVTQDGSAVLEIGSEVPASFTMLVTFTGQEEVYVVGAQLYEQMKRPWGEWRNRRPFPATGPQVLGLTLKGEHGRVVLRRSGDGWWSSEPVVDRGDRERLEALLHELTTLKVETFVDTPGVDLAVFGGSMVGTLEAELGQGGEKFVLEVGAPAGEGRRYMRSGELLFTAAGGLDEALSRRPVDWLSQTLSPVPLRSVRELIVSDAAGTFSLRRREAEWLFDDRPISSSPVLALLAALERARADQLVAAPASSGAALSLRLSGDGAQVSEWAVELEALPGGGAMARVRDRPLGLRISPQAFSDLVAAIKGVRDAG